MKNIIRFTQQDVAANRRLYSFYKSIKVHDGWEDRDKYGNFEQLVRIADFAGFPFTKSRCLDIGCGTGDFCGYLEQYGIKKYTGIDIYKPSIVKAARTYQSEFINSDFLIYRFRRKYDYVFFSGTLAARLPTDNYIVLEQFLRKMKKLALKGVAFNLLVAEYKGQKDSDFFLYDSAQVRILCKTICQNKQIIVKKSRAGDKLEFLQKHFYIF